ncbi:solute carrier family 35 member E2A-like [Mercenaria mercenaria]|uniref:solute carrier family 35 member E2A-like n=1 Tax=Mercenaria mercenaria TaxID=6596 RepID=UPI00234F207F|nr:solute carrier family 35 member E2A-like [Mercenaria mercenaria]XP_045162519.2 solute carrier family 35 member E2A-like [Mercenaria mercenaria]
MHPVLQLVWWIKKVKWRLNSLLADIFIFFAMKTGKSSTSNYTGVDMLMDNTKLLPATKSIIINRGDDDTDKGLMNPRAMIFLVLWYFFSFCTLFLNKYILSTLRGDPTMLGAMQMVMTTTLGFLQMYLPLGFYKAVDREGKPPNFWRNMIIVGSMRFATVVLGLVALKFVAVSFTETIKSSAPIFTVGISYMMLREYTGFFTILSLIPIMFGLGLCSAYELSFNIQGFTAALATNITECLQNVYSKMLISGEKYRYTPAELQFFTSISSVIVQIPACFFMIDFPYAKQTLDLTMLTALIMNGVFFHFQSISAYVLMGYISPVTHSVANTVKRAFLIWLSVIVFGNPVTFLSGLGTITVTIGVLCYTKAKEYDGARLALKLSSDSEIQVKNTKSRDSKVKIGNGKTQV